MELMTQMFRRNPWRRGRYFGQKEFAFTLLLILFLIGVVAGCVVGLFLSAGGGGIALLADSLPGSFWEAVWHCSQFFLLLLLLSTTWLGFLLTPFAALVRGYLFSCSISALFAAQGWNGMLHAMFASGIPALFLVPCFLISCTDAMYASGHLFSLRFGRNARLACSAVLPRILVVSALVLGCACYSYFLLPVLTG